MSIVMVEITKDAALFTEPESDEARFQNLLLNMMGGLEYKDLSGEEKALLKKYGYEE